MANNKTEKDRIAIFAATSGHSGVDRLMQHLIPALAGHAYRIDVLHVRKHGPQIDSPPEGVSVIDTGSSHVYSSLPAVVRYLKTSRPVVMLSDKDRVNRTALLARWLAGVSTRLVFSSGTTISIDLSHRGWFERWLQRFSMGRLYRYADNVIVTSKGVADDMAAYTGLERSRIEVVPCPVVPDDLFQAELQKPDHPWFANQQIPVVLAVGELSRRKDFATLIRAFAHVRQQRPCRLLILGKGDQKETLRGMARDRGIQEDVDLHGFAPEPYRFMAHADLLAFTSLWEGLGFVIIEALAVGTPVVATDCPSGPREILQDGKYGLLVPVGDDSALADAILATLDNRPRRPELQEAARPYGIANSTAAYLKAMGLEPVG